MGSTWAGQLLTVRIDAELFHVYCDGVLLKTVLRTTRNDVVRFGPRRPPAASRARQAPTGAASQASAGSSQPPMSEQPGTEKTSFVTPAGLLEFPSAKGPATRGPPNPP
jgi:hypothetical protein